MSVDVYVSRPVVVKAMQVAKPYKAVAEWSGGQIIRLGGPGNPVEAIQVGRVWAYVGDWIVLNSDKTLTVMSDHRFQCTYVKETL